MEHAKCFRQNTLYFHAITQSYLNRVYFSSLSLGVDLVMLSAKVFELYFLQKNIHVSVWLFYLSLFLCFPLFPTPLLRCLSTRCELVFFFFLLLVILCVRSKLMWAHPRKLTDDTLFIFLSRYSQILCVLFMFQQKKKYLFIKSNVHGWNTLCNITSTCDCTDKQISRMNRQWIPLQAGVDVTSTRLVNHTIFHS